jgi:hypothetical protein
LAEDGLFMQMLTELAEDNYLQGEIDIRDRFIDGKSAPANKRALMSAIPSMAMAPRSLQLQTLLVFLSSLTYDAINGTKYIWLKQSPKIALSAKHRCSRL